jgi:hypothetical protein
MLTIQLAADALSAPSAPWHRDPLLMDSSCRKEHRLGGLGLLSRLLELKQEIQATEAL